MATCRFISISVYTVYLYSACRHSQLRSLVAGEAIAVRRHRGRDEGSMYLLSSH
jgi:hypothetical protein